MGARLESVAALALFAVLVASFLLSKTAGSASSSRQRSTAQDWRSSVLSLDAQRAGSLFAVDATVRVYPFAPVRGRHAIQSGLAHEMERTATLRQYNLHSGQHGSLTVSWDHTITIPRPTNTYAEGYSNALNASSADNWSPNPYSRPPQSWVSILSDPSDNSHYYPRGKNSFGRMARVATLLAWTKSHEESPPNIQQMSVYFDLSQTNSSRMRQVIEKFFSCLNRGNASEPPCQEGERLDLCSAKVRGISILADGSHVTHGAHQVCGSEVEANTEFTLLDSLVAGDHVLALFSRVRRAVPPGAAGTSQVDIEKGISVFALDKRYRIREKLTWAVKE
eukprot:g35902.t1